MVDYSSFVWERPCVTAAINQHFFFISYPISFLGRVRYLRETWMNLDRYKLLLVQNV